MDKNIIIPSNLLDNLQHSIRIKNEYNIIRSEYREFLKELSKEEYNELLISNIFSAEEVKIAYKLLNFPGDISPTMLVKFGEALNRYNRSKE